MPVELIEIIKSFISWKEQLKLNLCFKEKFKRSFLVGRNQHKEALLYSIQKRNVRLVKDIPSHSRKDQLPRDFPFGDDFRNLIFKNSRIERVEHLEIVKMILTNKNVDPSEDENYAVKWASHRGHSDVVKSLLCT